MERSFRNAPIQACDDAILLTITFFIIPCAAAVEAVMAMLVPESLQIHYQGIKWTTVLALVLGLFFLTRTLRRYARIPEVASKFRSKASSATTLIIIFAVPALSIALLAFVMTVRAGTGAGFGHD
jgi:hypothetical protein